VEAYNASLLRVQEILSPKYANKDGIMCDANVAFLRGAASGRSNFVLVLPVAMLNW
jgi:hypothetical protein